MTKGTQHLPAASAIHQAMAEKELQVAVEQVLTTLGYYWFHDPNPDTNQARMPEPGFPDICAVHPLTGATIFIELKTEKGRMKPAQLKWMDALAKGPALYLGPVRPHQFDLLVDKLRELATPDAA